jgi:hypothetical protein
MATTSVRLAPEAAPNLQFALLTATGFVALGSSRVPPVVVIPGSAVWDRGSRTTTSRAHSPIVLLAAISLCTQPDDDGPAAAGDFH